jgi:hypothetical protein
VTREEFAVQEAVLARTREKLDTLEQRLADLGPKEPAKKKAAQKAAKKAAKKAVPKKKVSKKKTG